MKHLKMMGLVVVAAMALTALFGAGSASATTICTNDVEAATCTKATSITSGLASGTSAVLQAGFATVECSTSTVAGSITSQGAGIPASGPITTLSFSNCNCEVKTLKNGSLEANGTTLSGKSSEVTVNCFGTDCVYGTASTGTKIGTITDSTVTGATAKVDANASLPKISGGFLCASPASWTATYVVSNPDKLYIK